MICFVQLLQQSYLKLFQNAMFTMFLYWDLHGDEMNNLRVKVLVVKVLHSESEGSWFKPHYQDVKTKVYPEAFSSKLGNSKTDCLMPY